MVSFCNLPCLLVTLLVVAFFLPGCGNRKQKAEQSSGEITSTEFDTLNQQLKPDIEPKWVLRNPLPTASTLFSIAFGNDRFVALGAGLQSDTGVSEYTYTVLISKDGTTWDVHQVKAAGFGKTVFGNGRFVTNSTKGFFYSSGDGITWTKSTNDISQGHRINDLFFGESLFVAIGDSGLIMTSMDGIKWIRQKEFTNYNFLSGIYGSGKFVITGYKMLPQEEKFVSYVESPELNEETAETYYDQTLPESEGIFIVSSNGTDWDSAMTCNGFAVNCIAFGNNMFIGKTGDRYNDRYLKSLDGISWWSHYGPSRPSYDRKVECANNIFFILDLEPGCIYRSRLDKCAEPLTDIDTTWKASCFYTAQYLQSIVYGNDLYVAVGDGGLILKSINAVDWQPITGIPVNDLVSIAFGKGIFVTVGKYGAIVTSEDGIKWQKTSANTSNWFREVKFINNEFVAVGDNGLVVSPDGITWIDSTAPGYLTTISYCKGRYVVGTGGYVSYSSTDLHSWQAIKCTESATMKKITTNGGMFVGVSFQGDLFVSYDSFEWKRTYSAGREFHDPQLLHCGQLFVLYEIHPIIDTVYISTDGLIWRKTGLGDFIQEYRVKEGGHIVKDDNGLCLVIPELQKKIKFDVHTYTAVNAMVFGNNKYVAVGDAGTIVTLGIE